MQTLNYFLPRPPLNFTSEQMAAFDALWQSRHNSEALNYRLPYPKWQFLSYLCDVEELVLHGSQNPNLDIVNPVQANDVKSFSNQRAIYATTDGIWVIFFAILNRRQHPGMSLFNSCLQVRYPTGLVDDPLYFFSITASALAQKPWCNGAIYILPRKPFVQEPPQIMQGAEIVFPHWISDVPVKPLAKLLVGPQDFPFLEQIHGHNDQKLQELSAANPSGFPWPQALES